MIEPEQDAAETQILRAPLSRDTVIAAGVGFADEQGLDKLTMRKLAERLGVEAMSLYNHVKNKDDLLDGMVNAVIGEIALPQVGENWQAQMRLRALSAHATLLRHPWATLLIVSRMTCGLPMLRYMEASIGCLREAGC